MTHRYNFFFAFLLKAIGERNRSIHNGWIRRSFILRTQKYMSLKFYTQKNTWKQNLLPQKSLKYLNTDLLNQKDFKTYKKHLTDLLTSKKYREGKFSTQHIHQSPPPCILRVPPLPWGWKNF